jgi:hypothetical protein
VEEFVVQKCCKEVQYKGLWPWCITLAASRFMDCVHRPEF